MQYPIYDYFDIVGTVTIQQEGLYYTFRAMSESKRDGFVRLYYHRNGQTTRLGIFRVEDGVFCCEGKISQRQLGTPADGEFSLCEIQWHREEGYLARETDWGREVILPLVDSIPQCIVPYFCFLQKAEIKEIPCLSLKLDKQGMPFL